MLVAALLAAAFAGALASGRGDAMRALGPAGFFLDRDARTAILFIVLFGYVVSARRYLELSARAAFDALAPALRASRVVDLDRERTRVCDSQSPPRVRWLRALAALGVAPFVAFALDRDPGLYLRSDYWTFEHFLQWGIGLLLCGNLGLLADRSASLAQSFDALARRLPRIDLLALDGLAPFAQLGLRLALVWLLIVALFALNLVDVGYWIAVIGLGVVSLGLAAACLARLLSGVRARVRDAKRAELERVRRALRGDRSALVDASVAADASGLADLLAYRGFVEALPEWPFDAPMLARLVAYVAIPVGSWIGGAFVERILAATLE